MAFDRSKYPSNWEAISLQIRSQANWCCEWCGAPHKAFIQRLKIDPFKWRVSIPNYRGDADWHPARRCIITVHHIGVPYPDGRPGDPNDKMDCRPENLVALCNRCHLRADTDLRIIHARETRFRKERLAAQRAGQLEMFK